MSIETLDVSLLPTECMFEGETGFIDLAVIPMKMRGAVESLASSGMIKANDSFGCAVGRIGHTRTTNFWDDPFEFVMFVEGWGPERDRYIANAVRKMRAGLREGMDTLLMRTDAIREGIPRSLHFRDIVESKEKDGSFKWGDFPWGGFTFTQVGYLLVPASVSCLYEVEDDALSRFIGGSVGAEMLKLSRPDEFGPNS